MATMNQLSDDLAKNIALELEIELEKVCPVKTGALRNSIEVIKDGDDYVIKMLDYWKYNEYIYNPFIRYTFNTKIRDILKKVTRKISR